jgi:hypothetical protein
METIEQAKNRLEISIDGKNGFYRGVMWANRWIDFQEEKPSEQGFYLVKCKNSLPNCNVVVAEFYEDNKIFYYVGTDCPIHDVAYWRPIERS